MNVGDIRKMMDGRTVEVRDLTIDSSGHIGVLIIDDDGSRYHSHCDPADLEAERETLRVDTSKGQVTIELPTDGKSEVRAVWSKTATDAITKG